jgi:hypothetical protein
MFIFNFLYNKYIYNEEFDFSIYIINPLYLRSAIENRLFRGKSIKTSPQHEIPAKSIIFFILIKLKCEIVNL